MKGKKKTLQMFMHINSTYEIFFSNILFNFVSTNKPLSSEVSYVMVSNHKTRSGMINGDLYPVDRVVSHTTQTVNYFLPLQLALSED